jgi:fatty acid desaturase
MSLIDGRYEERKTRRPPLVLLILGLAVPVSLVLIGMGAMRDRRWLVLPVVLLLAARVIERMHRKRRK